MSSLDEMTQSCRACYIISELGPETVTNVPHTCRSGCDTSNGIERQARIEALEWAKKQAILHDCDGIFGAVSIYTLDAEIARLRSQEKPR